MYAIIMRGIDGEENVSERNEVGYYTNEDQANQFAINLKESEGKGKIVQVKEVDEVFMASQSYLRRVRGI